jgi:CubicO group peptidase (beta-lactamase class C family)
MSIKRLLYAVAFACIVPTAEAQVPGDWPDVVRQFDAYMAADKIVADSILYMREGKVLTQYNAGYADRAAKRLVETVLAHASIEEMWQPGKPMRGNQWMGLSTFVIKRGNATLLGHTGGQGFFRGYVFFNPATSAAVVYAFNTTSDASGETMAALRDRVYNFLAK